MSDEAQRAADKAAGFMRNYGTDRPVPRLTVDMVREHLRMIENAPPRPPCGSSPEHPHVQAPHRPWCIQCGLPEDMWATGDVSVPVRRWFEETNTAEVFKDRHGEAPGSPSKERKVVPRSDVPVTSAEAFRAYMAPRRARYEAHVEAHSAAWDEVIGFVQEKLGVELLPFQRRVVEQVLDADARGERLAVLQHGRKLGWNTIQRVVDTAREHQARSHTMDLTPEQQRELERIIGEAIGAGSTCWSRLEDAGVFQPEQASAIVTRTVEEVKALFAGVVKEVPVVVPED